MENHSPVTLWAGRTMSALPALFLLVDGAMKLVKPEPVVKATVELGYPESVLFGLGMVLLACTILFDPTDCCARCHLADGLPGRCRGDPRARRCGVVFDLLPDRSGGAPLGRTYLSG
jgi:hypothetical protein